MKKQKALPLGHHKAYIRGIRFIKKVELGKDVVRIETTYDVKGYGNYTHYTSAFKMEE